jgi:general secretion pathway protein D
VKRIFTLAVFLALAACASNPHTDAGKRLLAENKPEQALLELEQAVRDQPSDIEARATLERTRGQVAGRRAVQGENARIAGDFDAAETAFKGALTASPGYPSAQSGLKQLEIDRNHRLLIDQASESLKKNDLFVAEMRVRTVLAQNPRQLEARKILKDIEQKRADARATAPTTPAMAKPVTLEFRETPIRSVFEILSRTSGVNFVFDKDVRPDIKVTIFVRDSTVDEVMKLVLVTNQLASKPLNGNSVLIYPNNPAKVKDYQELVVKSFYLSNTDVKQAQTMVKAIVKSKDVFVDEKLNLLVVKDTPEAVRLVEKLLESLDMADPEVMLEVEVLEISRNKLLDLGLQFPEQVGYGKITPDVVNTTITTTGSGTSTTFGGALAPGNIDLRKHAGLTSYVANPGALLNIKDQDGNSRLLANPRIRVKNREKAKILIGDKIPVFTTTSTANVGVSASVNYLEVGLKLEVEPNVSLEDEVSIKVGLEVSSIGKEVAGPAGSIAYQIGTRSADTNLRLHDGETQVLAGLINDEERSSANHLPGIGDIPLVGRLFSSQRDSSSKTEIVLLITPHIVRNLVRPEGVEPAVPSGTDSAIGVAPLSLKATTSLSLKSSSAANPPPSPADGAVPEPASEPAPEPVAEPPPVEATRPSRRGAVNPNPVGND